MLLFVTAFYPARTDVDLSSYWADFAHLTASGVPILLFLDPTYPVGELPDTVRVCRRPLQRLIPEGVEPRLPLQRNPSKDTAQFLTLMLHKLSFLSQALSETDASHLAWIDFRLFHVVRDVPRVQEKLRALAARPPQTQKILAPGCWAQETSVDILNQICWRFCGGFLVGPRHCFPPADLRQRELVSQCLPHLTWEVNYWARMEEVFEWYPADHNDSLLLNVPESASTTASSEA